MAMAADGRDSWPRARTMTTAANGCDHGHAHIHGGNGHGHITRVRRWYGHVRSGNGYGRGLPRERHTTGKCGRGIARHKSGREEGWGIVWRKGGRG